MQQADTMGPKQIKRKIEEGAKESATKKQHGGQKYLPEYTEKYPILTRFEGSEYRIYCNACKSDFGISHGGIDDCKRHVDGPMHEAKYKTYKSQLTLSAMFGKSSGAIDPVAEKRKHDVTSAELNTMRFFVEHNIAFSSADHCSNLFHTNFPDSKIATEYKAARTKMTAMVKYQAEEISSKIAEKSKPVFCLSTDGSNDNNDNDNVRVFRVITEMMVKLLKITEIGFTYY